MAKGKPAFVPLPVRAMSDGDLTALELRVLSCICWHDRLSKSRESRGCYASNATMALEVGCTITSLSRAISVLVKQGYVERDHGGVPGKKHLTVYRVLHDETIAPLGNKHLPNEATDDPQSFARDSRDRPQSFARDECRNGGNQPRIEVQETSLREERDSVETEERNSSEDAHFAARGHSRIEFAENVGAQLARFERHWKASPYSYDVGKLEKWSAFCMQVEDAYDVGDPEHGQAQRLASEIDFALDELRNGEAA